MAERLGEVDRAELDALGPAGRDAEGRPALEDAAVVAVDEVVGHPDRVVAEPLGLDDRVDGPGRLELGPGRRAEEGRPRVGEGGDAEAEAGRHQPFRPDIVTPWTK